MPSDSCQAWCLQSPEGKLIPQTLALYKRNAQGAAFDYLYSKFPDGWPRDYWKQWDPFVRARKKRGWYVVSVTCQVNEDTPKA